MKYHQRLILTPVRFGIRRHPPEAPSISRKFRFSRYPGSTQEKTKHDVQAAHFLRMTEVIEPAFSFLSGEGESMSRAVRAWVVLYVVNPRAIGNESIDHCAARNAVDREIVLRLIAGFRQLIVSC